MFMVFKELVIHTSIISIKGVLNDFYSVYGGFVYVYGKNEELILHTSMHLLACYSPFYLIRAVHIPIHVNACTAVDTFKSAHQLSVIDQLIHYFFYS